MRQPHERSNTDLDNTFILDCLLWGCVIGGIGLIFIALIALTPAGATIAAAFGLGAQAANGLISIGSGAGSFLLFSCASYLYDKKVSPQLERDSAFLERLRDHKERIHNGHYQ